MRKTMGTVSPERSPRKGGVRSKIVRQASLPPDVTARIQGRVVDISGASRFHEKQWEIHRPQLPTSVEDRGTDHYELSAKFFPAFEKQLRIMLGKGLRKESGAPANLIISAICYLADEGERSRNLDSDALQHWPVWPSSRSISEAWEELGLLPIPWLDSVTIEQPAPGSRWRKRIDVDSGFPKAKVDPYFNTDKEELPRLTIEIEGAPVCRLMRAHYRLGDEEKQRAMRKEAKQFWDAIVLWSSSALGFGHPSKGRPKTGQGYKAAFLHDHLGLSWGQVAQRLCPKDHRHLADCKENFRKQAEQYWGRIRAQHTRQSR